MAIAFTKYVNITSGIGGTTQAVQRDLIGRMFSDNLLIPTGSILEFTDSESVGNYFGFSSEEFSRASVYFAYISKNITSPNKLSFARWVDADTAPMIFGLKLTSTLAEFQAIADGSFDLTIGATTNSIIGLDFSAALSFADVATVMQAEINLQVGAMWTGATVVFNAVRGSLDFEGGDLVADGISASVSGVGTDILTQIGWTNNAIFSAGSLMETITEDPS